MQVYSRRYIYGNGFHNTTIRDTVQMQISGMISLYIPLMPDGSASIKTTYCAHQDQELRQTWLLEYTMLFGIISSAPLLN